MLQQGRLLQLGSEPARRLEQRGADLAALSPRGRLREVGAPVYQPISNTSVLAQGRAPVPVPFR